MVPRRDKGTFLSPLPPHPRRTPAAVSMCLASSHLCRMFDKPHLREYRELVLKGLKDQNPAS